MARRVHCRRRHPSATLPHARHPPESSQRSCRRYRRRRLGHCDFGSASWRDGVDAVVKAVAAGDLKVPIAEVFPFGQCADMYARLLSRQVPGKLVLAVRPGM
jgi:NADPH:quinone reductase-like Zn-dependent oxidoreductase